MPDLQLHEQSDLEAALARPPGWALRWGMLALLLVFALLWVLAWLVRYPDVVQARAVLTTQNPPIRLVAGASARIAKLTVANGQTVQTGDLLGVLDNPARLEDVERLAAFLKKMTKNDASAYLSAVPPERLQLGSLQNGFALFLQSFKDLQYFLKRDINFLKISNLRQQIVELESLNQSLARQEKILAEELAIARKNYERDSALFSKNSLFPFELEQTQTAWLRSRRELETLHSGKSQNNLRIRQMESQILDLQQLQSDSRNERLLAFQSELQKLNSEIAAWRQTWLLVAPIGGKAALTKARSEQQFVEAGEEVLTIVPQQSAGRPFAKAMLSSEGAGKVSEGMAARIRLDGFPHQEFGVLNGIVMHIAAVPGEAGYELEISLNDSLTTSYGKIIPFRQEMQGTVRIVTKKRSILQRIFGKLRVAFEEN